MDEIETLDAIGLLCPLPVLKLRKRLKAVMPGDCLRLVADDPAAVIDVPHFCAEARHSLVSVTECEMHTEYVVRKGSG